MYYLQLTKTLITFFLLTSPAQWNIKPIPTIYRYGNGDTVYVAEGRWIDTLEGNNIIDPNKKYGIDPNLKTYEVNIVFLNDTEIVK
jgi:hypothetical protein